MNRNDYSGTHTMVDDQEEVTQKLHLRPIKVIIRSIKAPGSSDEKVEPLAETGTSKNIPPFDFVRKSMKTFLSLVLWVLPSYLFGRLILHVWDMMHDNGTLPNILGWEPFLLFRLLTTRLTYYISLLFSIPVEIKGTSLIYSYPNLLLPIEMIVIPDCTAFLEMIFITAMMMGFNLHLRVKERLGWAALLCGIIFIENIARLVLNGPLLHMYGLETWEKVHMFWWQYGQLIFVILLFLVWFVLIGSRAHPFGAKPSQSSESISNQEKNIKKTRSE